MLIAAVRRGTAAEPMIDRRYLAVGTQEPSWYESMSDARAINCEVLNARGSTSFKTYSPTKTVPYRHHASSATAVSMLACVEGESVSSLIKDPPPGAPVPPILPPRDGYLFLDRAKFRASFAADVDANKAEFMADSQVPWGVEALAGAITRPAWKTKPSWYLVATEDRMIPPPAQRFMSQRAGATVLEIAGSHSVYVSQPEVVSGLIRQAAETAAK